MTCAFEVVVVDGPWSLLDTLGDRDLPGGALDVTTIQFENLGGSVEATFYAVPLT